MAVGKLKHIKPERDYLFDALYQWTLLGGIVIPTLQHPIPTQYTMIIFPFAIAYKNIWNITVKQGSAAEGKFGK